MSKEKELPENLSFSASLTASYFRFFGEAESGELRPVEVRERKVRGPHTHYYPDPVAAIQLDKKSPIQANGQWVDGAYLGTDEHALVVKGSLFVYPNSLRPHVVSKPEMETALERFTQLMKQCGGYAEIARRFTLNIARGLFLWHNAQLGPSTVTVTVEGLGSHTFACIPLRRDMTSFSFNLFDEADRGFAESLAARIEAALSEEQPYALKIDVAARVEAAPGMAVRPSQLWPRKEESKGDDSDKKSKYLATLKVPGSEIGQAVLTPEKVTAAIKRIDTWYGGARPIGVSVYGTDLTRANAYRTGKDLKGSAPTFYACLKGLPTIIEALERDQQPSDHALFALAMLIHGGVFSVGSEKKKGGRKRGADKDAAEEEGEEEAA